MGRYFQKIKDREILEEILNEIETKLDEFEYTKEEKNNVRLIADELTTNALSYTTDLDSVVINYILKRTEVRLKIKSKGKPFDWEQYIAPGYLKKINTKLRISGRGIAITHKLVDELNYEFKKGYVIACARYKRN